MASSCERIGGEEGEKMKKKGKGKGKRALNLCLFRVMMGRREGRRGRGKGGWAHYIV